jgi:hypothetical protein
MAAPSGESLAGVWMDMWWKVSVMLAAVSDPRPRGLSAMAPVGYSYGRAESASELIEFQSMSEEWIECGMEMGGYGIETM